MMLAKTVEKEIDLLEKVAAVLRGEVIGERECALIANQVHELIYTKRKDLVQIKAREEEVRRAVMKAIEKFAPAAIEKESSRHIKPFTEFSRIAPVFGGSDGSK